MEGLVNILGAATALVCAALLYRGYRGSRARLLLWSVLCFLALSLESALVFIDRFIVPEVSLSLARQLIAIFGIACLIYGLVWDSD